MSVQNRFSEIKLSIICLILLFFLHELHALPTHELSHDLTKLAPPFCFSFIFLLPPPLNSLDKYSFNFWL